MKYFKLSKISKCLIANTLLTSAIVGIVVPTIAHTNITNSNIANNNLKMQTGKIIHNTNTRVVNNINELSIQSLNPSFTKSSSSFSAIVNNNGIQEMYVWGFNENGELGLGDIANKNSPVKFDLSVFGAYDRLDFNLANDDSAGISHAVVYSTRGQELYMWGDNSNGSLGLGPTIDQQRPVLINKASLGNYDSIQSVNVSNSVTFVITVKNNKQQLFACGRNDNGQLGINNGIKLDTFRLVDTAKLGNYISIEKFESNGQTTSALINTTTGLKLYVWGDNSQGQLGLGSNQTKYLEPTLQPNSIFSSINLSNPNFEYSIGWLSSYALNKTTNELFTWGANTSGGLGIGGTNPAKQISPILILASSFNGEIIKEIQIHHNSSYAITSKEGSADQIYVWGENNNGQLGLDDIADKFSPTQLKASAIGNPDKILKFHLDDSNLVSTFSSYALFEINGNIELYVWGKNAFGSLGVIPIDPLNPAANVTVPNKPVLPNDMKIVDAFVGNSSCVKLIDNKNQFKYYVTGKNTEGQLGNGNFSNQNSFMEVLPTKFSAFVRRDFSSIHSAPSALDYLKIDSKNRLQEFFNFLDVPQDTVITIDNASTAEFRTGILNLIFTSSLTKPPLSAINQLTNSKYTFQLQFRPVNDINTNPPSVLSDLPFGINASEFYSQIVSSNGIVKNLYLLSKYVDLSSIPVNATLEINPISISDDPYRLEFALTTNMVYNADGIIETLDNLTKKTFNLTIDLPYINWPLILGLSIPGGVILIGGIIFSIWYFKYKRL